MSDGLSILGTPLGALNTATPDSPTADSIWQRVEHIEEINTHTTNIFPDNTNLTCTLTALATTNTFSSWAEIEDNTGGTTIKLSAKFATYPGHITAMILESVSEDNTIYEAELSYGSSKTIITRWRFAGSTKFLNASHQVRVRGAEIPAAETIYYRMKSATAVADTAVVHFRYYLYN